jgi:hypothetical protein
MCQWPSYCITITSSIVFYVVLRLENRRRDRLELDESLRDKMAFADMTDRENMFFRYVL